MVVKAVELDPKLDPASTWLWVARLVLREDLMEYAIVCHGSNMAETVSHPMIEDTRKKSFFIPYNAIVDRETT